MSNATQPSIICAIITLCAIVVIGFAAHANFVESQSYHIITQTDINIAKESCKNFGGLSGINGAYLSIYDIEALCANGSRVIIRNKKRNT